MGGGGRSRKCRAPVFWDRCDGAVGRQNFGVGALFPCKYLSSDQDPHHRRTVYLLYNSKNRAEMSSDSSPTEGNATRFNSYSTSLCWNEKYYMPKHNVKKTLIYRKDLYIIYDVNPGSRKYHVVIECLNGFFSLLRRVP